SWMLHLLLVLPFSNLDVYRLTGSDNPLPSRSAFYDFLSNTAYNWRGLLWQVAQTLVIAMHQLTSEEKARVLILDESPYKRDRSKKVEYLGRQYDHSQNTHYRGFRMLSLGWSDGHS